MFSNISKRPRSAYSSVKETSLFYLCVSRSSLGDGGPQTNPLKTRFLLSLASTFAALQEYLQDPPGSQLPWLESAIRQCIGRLKKCYDPYPAKSEASRRKLQGNEIEVDGEKVKVSDTERELAIKVSLLVQGSGRVLIPL
jgi:hypothetical protein